MKIFIAASCLLLSLISINACKTIKTEELQKVTYNVLLKKDVVGDHLENYYKDYNANGVKKNSRSKNQYAVTFSTTAKKISKLEAMMKEDEKIVTFTKPKSTDIKVKTTTNVKKN